MPCHKNWTGLPDNASNEILANDRHEFVMSVCPKISACKNIPIAWIFHPPRSWKISQARDWLNLLSV